ncbi:hypothetical protein [Angelakisella massiliensis]|uniref:hypothetical protein n=1 Tax=Angelakisella massiliensis TaxID=1871018 RepID=UPI0024B1838A|nr:hypothetical protein [Angelakisella massiliensis]
MNSLVPGKSSPWIFFHAQGAKRILCIGHTPSQGYKEHPPANPSWLFSGINHGFLFLPSRAEKHGCWPGKRNYGIPDADPPGPKEQMQIKEKDSERLCSKSLTVSHWKDTCFFQLYV